MEVNAGLMLIKIRNRPGKIANKAAMYLTAALLRIPILPIPDRQIGYKGLGYKGLSQGLISLGKAYQNRCHINNNYNNRMNTIMAILLVRGGQI
jgi:hypothetical protein